MQLKITIIVLIELRKAESVKNAMLKLSIITINLNNTIGLEKTIESVIGQTFLDFEFIVIDGGSTDGSIDIIKQYDNKITYWVSEPDKGIYNAMNKGIRAAKGEYCLFLNSGDYLLDNNTLENVFSNNLNEDIIYGDMIEMKNNVEINRKSYPDTLTFKHFYFDTLSHPGTFIKRQLFNKIGYYNETYVFASDWEFFLIAILKMEYSYIHINQYISYFDRTGISSEEKNYERMMNERAHIMEKLFPFFYQDYVEMEIINKKLTNVMNNLLLFWVKKKLYPLYKFLVKSKTKKNK